MPSSCHNTVGLHAAIIMDGNGRWACRHGSPRHLGHRAGADAVQSVVEAAPELGITTLTLYAFSSDNWSRPRREVANLFRLLRSYLIQERPSCLRHGVRVRVIGRRDRLPAELVRIIERVELETGAGSRLHLRLAVDYSSRDSLLKAASPVCGSPPCTREQFSARMNRAIHSEADTPDVDLLIRTGGEKRLSDFLLWESAYAELVFVDVLWPDFSARDLSRAVTDFRRRDRRFGRVGTPAERTPREESRELYFGNEVNSPASELPVARSNRGGRAISSFSKNVPAGNGAWRWLFCVAAVSILV